MRRLRLHQGREQVSRWDWAWAWAGVLVRAGVGVQLGAWWALGLASGGLLAVDVTAYGVASWCCLEIARQDAQSLMSASRRGVL